METPNKISVLVKPTTILLIGPSQAGKSTFVNHLFGVDLAKVSLDGKSCTNSVSRYCKYCDESVLWLYDTPGISDTYLSDAEIKKIVLDGVLNGKGSPKRKCIFLFLKFGDATTGSATQSVNLVKSIYDANLSRKIQCSIVLILTFASVHLSTFPIEWKLKKQEGKNNLKGRDLGIYLWEEMKKERVEFVQKQLGNSIPLKIITVDCGVDENDDFIPYGPVQKEQVVTFIKDNFPNLVPHLHPEVIKNSLKLNENVLKTATTTTLAVTVAASFVLTPFITVPVGMLSLSFITWASSSKVTYINIYLGHNQRFCHNQNSILKFRKVHKRDKDLSIGFIWTVEFIEEEILLKNLCYISIKNQKLEMMDQRPMKGWGISMKKDSKKIILSFKENLYLKYLCVQKNTFSLVESVQDASEFSLILVDQ